VRCRRQPRQLGRTFGQCGRRGDRHRDRDPRYLGEGRLRRHRLRRADRDGRRRRRPAALLRSAMTFLWPTALWLLAGVPLLVAFYVWLLKRRKQAIAYPHLALVRRAMGKTSSVRRHIPPALFLAALALMVLALARPA